MGLDCTLQCRSGVQAWGDRLAMNFGLDEVSAFVLPRARFSDLTNTWPFPAPAAPFKGRAELPESLKALFRPITVVVPDRQLIMENMLMAEASGEASILRSLSHIICPHMSLCLPSGQERFATQPVRWQSLQLYPPGLPSSLPVAYHAIRVQGFVEAKILAKKFASLYFLLEDLLSPAKHYDW